MKTMNMKLNDYKTRYKRAKRSETKTKVMNAASLNLSDLDFQAFLKWQIKFMQL